MKFKVLKFGGTSVADERARAAAAQRVADALEHGYAPVAVVSAIGRRGAPYATDTLIQELQQVNPGLSMEPRDLDLIMACGEIISAAIFAQTLRGLGLKAAPMTGDQAGITTDGQYGSARIKSVDPARIVQISETGAIPVICGFQGTSENNRSEITTLGRGGTDTTAAAIGAALQACAVEIYTDVDGIKTADPNWVPNAPTLHKVGYDEVAELAHLGAKVLHPRAAEIAMRYGVPLWVKNSFTGHPGTEIVAEQVSYERNITGITHSGRIVYLQFDLNGVSAEEKSTLEKQMFGVLARFGVNLYMVNVSPTGLGFGISASQYSRAERVLDGLVIPLDGLKALVVQLGSPSDEVQAQRQILGNSMQVQTVAAERAEGCTMISVIGRTYFGKPGVFFRILSILHEAKIQVFQTGDSDFSVSFLIPETETRRAVQVLHDALVPAEVH